METTMNSIYDGRLLVVDDNEELCRMLTDMLHREGFRQVYTAGTCAQALSFFETGGGQAEMPDLVILDINLPDGDGFSLMQKIRMRSQTPVLFLSARDEDNDRLLYTIGIWSSALSPDRDTARDGSAETAAASRRATVFRATSETGITVMIDLDGKGPCFISTGIGFFDHALEQIVHHGGISLLVEAKGDLHVDEHHTVEDVAIVLGKAVSEALGSKIGIGRYGFVLPMDESEASVLIDLGGRTDFSWDAEFSREKIGDMPTEMFRHFFKSFAESACCNLHISARGENEHHKIEGIFKAFARALKMAIARDRFPYSLPSSKGVL